MKFAGLNVTSLIDTGAASCLLEIGVYNQIKHDPSIIQHQSDVTIKSITGNIIDIIGCFSIPLSIGSKEIRHPFYIVKGTLAPQYQAIIGYDFLKLHNFNIDLRNDTLISNDATIELHNALPNNPNDKPLQYARLIHKLTLLPHESKVVNLKVQKNVIQGDNIHFNPVANSSFSISPQTCIINSDKSISVPITNLTSSKIPLNKNMRLGTISAFNKIRDMEEIKHLRRQELRETDFNLSHLDSDTRSQLLALLFEFSDIFSKRLYTIGRTDALTPSLSVDKSELPSSRPYTVPQALQGELKRQLDELEAANLIEKSDSHISFPSILVKKKNPSGDPAQQKYRFVVDYRKLNSKLKYPRHKLPIINHLLENLRGDKYFCSLDLSSSFWQIPLKPEDRDITTFSSQFGSYRFTTMPQGLSASPETFAKLSDQILAPISHLKYSNYIDDYCVGSKTISTMLMKLRKLFERFRLFGLTLNPSKCSFLLPKIEFLGHELSGSGIKNVDANIKKFSIFQLQIWLVKSVGLLE